MFCRKCGKNLLNGDRFCSYCGARVIERAEPVGEEEKIEEFEEVIYNDSSKLVELLDAVLPKKSTGKVKQGKSEKSISKSQIWNLEGFPSADEETRKTEEIVVDWGTSNVDADSDQKVDIGNKLEPQKNKEEPVEKENNDGFDLGTEPFDRKTNLQFEPNQTSSDSTEKFYTFSKKNEEFQKLLDKEYERLKKDELPERKEPINLDKLEAQSKGGENVTGIEKIFQASAIKSENEETQEESQILKGAQTPSVERFDEEKHVKSMPSVADSTEPITEGSTEPITEGSTEPITEGSTEPITEGSTEPITEDSTEPTHEIKSDEKTESDSQEVKNYVGVENPDQVIFPWDEIGSEKLEFFDEDANRTKISPVKIIISAVVAILVFEIAILGVKFFLPESGAAALINEKLGVVVNWVDVLNNPKDSKEPLAEEDKKAEEGDIKPAEEASKPAEGDIKPEEEASKPAEEVNTVVEEGQNKERDLKEVLDTLRVYNFNIQSICINETLGYEKTKNYADKNINNSTPIENNIWYQDKNGNNVYLDSEIYKTLISFNSLWIDYLDGKNTKVLSLTKEGSNAYKKVKTFSKVGKISEVFKVLELGEIRKGNNGYYIWVKEEIQVTENNQVNNKIINNIYYLEPVEQEIKIVDYFEY